MSVDFDIEQNIYGIKTKTIPSLKCAFARDIGSRNDNKAIVFLVENWLPNSGKILGEHPIIFHYLNVGPSIEEDQMITDVYLPLI